MSEVKQPRELLPIQQDYQNNCARAGQIRYQIDCLERDLGLVLGDLRELNFEAASRQKLDADKKASESPSPGVVEIKNKEEGNS